MIFIIRIADCFGSLIDWLSFINRRWWLPYIRIFKWIRLLIVWIGFVCTESSIRCSKLTRCSSIWLLICNWFIRLNRKLSILPTNYWAIVISQSTEHSFDRFNCILLSYNITLKFSPIFYVLFGNIIKYDFLLDWVNYFLKLLDGFLVFSQICKIACLFQIMSNFIYFALHLLYDNIIFT